MHQRALESDIIIVNHHLFFADLSLQRRELRRRHPARLSRRGVRRSARNRRRGRPVFRRRASAITASRTCAATSASIGRMKKFGTPELDRILQRLDELTRALLRPLRRGRAARGLHRPRRLPRGQRGDLHGPAGRARTDRLAPQAAAESAGGDHSAVPPHRGTERRGCASSWKRTTRISSTGWRSAAAAASCRPRPSTCPSIVAERLFEQVDTVVLTSATLAVAGGFDFTEKRLGLENARTLVVPGHFDYQKQALLYVPQHLPEPQNPAFTKWPPRKWSRFWSTAAGAPSCCSPAISRCAWCTTRCRSKSNTPR